MGCLQEPRVVWKSDFDDPSLINVGVGAPVDDDVRVRLLLDKPHAKERWKAMDIPLAGHRGRSFLFGHGPGAAVFDEFRATTELLMDKIAAVVNRETIKSAMTTHPTPTMAKR